MRILLVTAFVLMIFAVIVATGTAFLTGWNVWLWQLARVRHPRLVAG